MRHYSCKIICITIALVVLCGSVLSFSSCSSDNGSNKQSTQYAYLRSENGEWQLLGEVKSSMYSCVNNISVELVDGTIYNTAYTNILIKKIPNENAEDK